MAPADGTPAAFANRPTVAPASRQTTQVNPIYERYFSRAGSRDWVYGQQLPCVDTLSPTDRSKAGTCPQAGGSADGRNPCSSLQTAASTEGQAYSGRFPQPVRTAAAPAGGQAHKPDGTSAAPAGSQPVAPAAGRNRCSPRGRRSPKAGGSRSRTAGGPTARRNRCGSPRWGRDRMTPRASAPRTEPCGAGIRLLTAQPEVAPRRIVYRTAGTISGEPMKRRHSA